MNVTIVKDAVGNAVRATKNPEWSYIQVKQTRHVFANGWFSTREVYAIITGKTDDMLAAGFNTMKSIPGKIVIKEQLTPFNDLDPDRDLKRAGKDGPICCYHDQPIYSKNVFTSNIDEADTFINHTNGEEIRQWNAMNREEKEATGSGFFTAPAVNTSMPPIPPAPPTASSTTSPTVPAPSASTESATELSESDDIFEDFDFTDGDEIHL